MYLDGEHQENEIDCEECGDRFSAPGTWEVDHIDSRAVRREWYPDEGEEICDECKEKPVHEVIITIKAEKEDIENALIKDEQALFSFALEAMEIPSAHIQSIEVREPSKAEK